MYKKLKGLCLIPILMTFGFSYYAAGDNFSHDWESIRQSLVSEAKKINKCNWDLTEKNIKSIDELDTFLSENHTGNKNTRVFFVTFNSYCGEIEKGSFVSAYVFKDNGIYKVVDLGLIED